MEKQQESKQKDSEVKLDTVDEDHLENSAALKKLDLLELGDSMEQETEIEKKKDEYHPSLLMWASLIQIKKN